MGRVRPDKPKPMRPSYITAEGQARLLAEVDHLWRIKRPEVTRAVSEAAALGDRSENAEYIYGKKMLREIDRRVRFLSKRLENAEVVDPLRQERRGQVFFGATVTYADPSGRERRVSIVGADEVDADRGRVSWISPIARALLRAEVGDEVALRTPQGMETIEVLAIDYVAIVD